MSERRPRVQSGEALNLVLLDPMSGTEPEIDFPDHDEDPGGEPVLPRMLIVARMYQLRKYSMKFLRTTQHGQFVVFLRKKNSSSWRFLFKNNIYGPHTPSKRQSKDKLA